MRTETFEQHAAILSVHAKLIIPKISRLVNHVKYIKLVKLNEKFPRQMVNSVTFIRRVM